MDTNQHSHLQNLHNVLDDFREWFLQVAARLFYPLQDHEGEYMVPNPESFEIWLVESQKDNVVSKDMVKNLTELHSDLLAQALTLLNETSRSRAAPSFSEYSKLSMLFDEFARHVRRLEKDCMVGVSGVDTLTGLRTKEMLDKDVRREMDRLSRQGKPFALALIKIDRFEDMKKSMSPETVNDCIKISAELIKKCMRSFDDGYNLGEGRFVLSLKQTGTPGAIKAINRLKAELAKSEAVYQMNGQTSPISLSSCIGEPTESNDIINYIHNLEKDLETYQGDKGTILEHYEISPLQRFIKEQAGG